MYLSRFVIPSAAEGSFSFPVSVFLRNAVCMRRRTPKSHEARCFPFTASLTAFPDRERKRFLAFARNDDAGKATFSYLPPSGGRRESARNRAAIFCPSPFSVQGRLPVSSAPCIDGWTANESSLEANEMTQRERPRCLHAKDPAISLTITGSFLRRGSLNSSAYPFPPAASPLFYR